MILSIKILFLTFLVAFLAGCATAPKTPPVEKKPETPAKAEPARKLSPTEETLTEAARLLGEDDFSGALALFDTLDRADAAKPPIQLLRASVLLSAARLEEARAVVEAVLADNPGSLDALFILASVEGAAGREKQEKATLERIVKEDAGNADALAALGQIAMRKSGAAKSAAAYFDRALEADPAHQEALLGRAELFRAAGKVQSAEELLNRAIAAYPRWAPPYAERARIYRERGLYPEALADLDKAQEYGGEGYWIACDRGTVLIKLKRKREALEEFKKATALDPDSFLAFVYSAGIRDELGDWDGAEADYRRLTQIRPEYYFAFEGLGTHLLRRGRWLEARDAFLAAYRAAPQETQYALLGAFCWLRGEGQSAPSPAAKQYIDAALKEVPRDGLEWYMLRLYRDFAGDGDIASRIEREQNRRLKARMLFYLAGFYDIRGKRGLANTYYLQVREQQVRDIPEWRLNEWILAERGLPL